MNKNTMKIWFTFFGLSLIILFPSALSAKGRPDTASNTYQEKVIVAVLPFAGDEEAAETFSRATITAVNTLKKYNPWRVSIDALEEAEIRIPTDMPPVKDLVLGSRFALTGGVYPGNDSAYYLQLWLWDMNSSTLIYTDDLLYEEISEGLATLNNLVEWLFEHIIEVTQEEEAVIEKDWEEKRLSFGVRSGVSQRWYMASEETVPGAYALDFEGGVFSSVFITPLLSLQAEVDFTMDDLVYRGITNTGTEGNYIPVLENERYRSYSLMFPVMAKFNFRPGIFRLAPFAGAYAFLPLGEAAYRKNPTGTEGSFSWSSGLPLGLIGGLEAAMKLGPGMILADLRFAGDIDRITIHDAVDTAYRRGMVSFSLGYSLGFLSFSKEGRK